ncbi:hypothetical protein [Motiliproteus sp.]|uniref:hypothetical protein n=1 Tax=Motiliproteus sp. TaxID=1898955 RepID=UPI003BAD72FE
MYIDEKLNSLSTSLNTESFNILKEYAGNRTQAGRLRIAHVLVTYIGLLESPLRNNDSAELTRAFVYIRSHLCQNYTKEVVQQKLCELYNLATLLSENGLISGELLLPDKPRCLSTHKAYKEQTIPADHLKKIKRTNLSADEEFDNTLSRACSEAIAKRLKEHVYNFKIVKHHRNPLTNFLNFAHAEHPRWYEHPKVIEGTLLKFRNNLLSEVSRNSAYGKFQNVKNAINVLIQHKLISNETDSPSNLRRCTKTQKMRIDNPLLCATDIYDDRQESLFRNTHDFILEIATEIESNLSILLEEARSIVHKGYEKFANREQIIARSDKSEFLKRSDLRVEEYDVLNRSITRNPFSRCRPNRSDNLVAYFDHFYDCYIDGAAKHDVSDIRFNEEVRERLGLTTLVASAMQLVIVEELGINPYQLYNIKVSSDGHGHEFVQVTDNGSVRLRALKLRARHAKTRNAPGSLESLKDIPEQKINAATCLKMALEMTERVRAQTKQDELWLCTSKGAPKKPVPESFQGSFKKIRTEAAKKNGQLRTATLKKVRTSKGVWIYLDSRGDSLKTASYFGNTVKTTLARYIPEHLTELVFRMKIRSFQNLLLFMAVAHDESPAESLSLTSDNFKSQLKQAFENPDMGGRLYEKFKSTDKPEDETKYFCVSIKNIMLALKYAREGEDKSLKEDCLAAITKISEGPVIMKQLLRQAEKKINNFVGE